MDVWGLVRLWGIGLDRYTFPRIHNGNMGIGTGENKLLTRQMHNLGEVMQPLIEKLCNVLRSSATVRKVAMTRLLSQKNTTSHHSYPPS